MRTDLHQNDSHANVQRAYATTSVAETRRLYDEWAGTYDRDMLDQDYVAPALVAAAAVHAAGTGGQYLDAGCGSGAVGSELAKLRVKLIDGLDLSPGMLDQARKLGRYRDLDTADLSKPLNLGDATYDALVCCGTLTQGHVGPGALAEFARVVKSDGVIVATILDSIWASGGYEDEVQRLESEGQIQVVSVEALPYRRTASVLARVLVLRKSSH